MAEQPFYMRLGGGSSPSLGTRFRDVTAAWGPFKPLVSARIRAELPNMQRSCYRLVNRGGTERPG